jgi:cell division protein ZapA (FtsZ GTPase activity inhibitor)
MANNTLTISINNNKYTVAASNEDKVINAASLVNDAIDKCKDNFNKVDNFSQLDTITFAALNIAEKQISDEIYYNNQINIIVDEINSITKYMNDLLGK